MNVQKQVIEKIKASRLALKKAPKFNKQEVVKIQKDFLNFKFKDKEGTTRGIDRFAAEQEISKSIARAILMGRYKGA